MKFFARRRLVNSSVMFAALGGVWFYTHRLEGQLRSPNFFTGWVLLVAIASLMALALRKRLPAPPLGSAAAWLQVHIYTGIGSAGLFLLHIRWRWPGGWFEGTLAALFAATFASGVIGLYWTRTLPRRLSRLGEEVIYERIAAIRGQLRERAQIAVLSAVRDGGGTTLGEFYNGCLQDFFSQHRGWLYRLWPTAALRKRLLADLTDVMRYLSDEEQRTAEDLFALVRRRDDLDYHEALQWRLKAWLFVHIALTYPLVLAAVLHAWLAHVFYGGAA
jgi:hypothetical protein